MPSRWTVFALIGLVGPLAAAPAAAQWKWIDQKRQVQYSDLPPPQGTPEKDILQSPASAQRRAPAPVAPPASAASGPPALVPRAVEPELEAKRRQAEQDVEAKKTAELQKQAAAKAESCSRARAQVRNIDSGLRIARTNANGEREVLDDAARAAEARRAQAIVASDCQ